MENTKNFTKASYKIMEQLLEVDNIEDALSGTLEGLMQFLDCPAGAIWLLDPQSNRLSPVSYAGPSDISGLSVENGIGVEGAVTQTGQSMLIENCMQDPRFEGSVFDEKGFVSKTMICAPLYDLHETIGAVQLINKNDGSIFDSEELRFVEQMAALTAMTIEEKGLSIHEEEDKEVLISLRDVIKEFPSGEGISRVLKGINLDIYQNEFVVVLGESGCGKSTMMNIIGGMDFLSEGQLLIEGRDYSHPSDEELTAFRRNYVGFIFQSYNLMPNLTALENVQFIAEIAPNPMDSMEALKKVGMDQKYDRYPSQLSGGQQQRVSIARALVKNPRVILADEPTAALDFATGQEVLKVIEDIVAHQGTTVVMVTHNAEIAKMANRVVKLRSGRVASIKKNLHPLSAEEILW